jgi:hypothetical protein
MSTEIGLFSFSGSSGMLQIQALTPILEDPVDANKAAQSHEPTLLSHNHHSSDSDSDSSEGTQHCPNERLYVRRHPHADNRSPDNDYSSLPNLATTSSIENVERLLTQQKNESCREIHSPDLHNFESSNLIPRSPNLITTAHASPPPEKLTLNTETLSNEFDSGDSNETEFSAIVPQWDETKTALERPHNCTSLCIDLPNECPKHTQDRPPDSS